MEGFQVEDPDKSGSSRIIELAKEHENNNLQILRRDFFLIQGAKIEHSELFETFCNAEAGKEIK